eukprot:44349-Chlamydomonas_euryale.AAC.2
MAAASSRAAAVGAGGAGWRVGCAAGRALLGRCPSALASRGPRVGNICGPDFGRAADMTVHLGGVSRTQSPSSIAGMRARARAAAADAFPPRPAPWPRALRRRG